MTIIEKSAFTGVNQFECRPFARVRMGQQLKAVAQDQAYAYKLLTGVEVPNAPSVDVAADHIHDGTNGACIPIPAAQEWIGANLARPSNDGGIAPVVFFPFYAPPGFSTYKLHLITRTPEQTAFARCSVMNSSLVTTAGCAPFSGLVGGGQQNQSIGAGLFVLTSEISVTADSLNIMRLEFPEDKDQPDADILAYSLVPYFGDSITGGAGLDYPSTDSQILAPSAGLHLSTAPFTSFDDGMFDDDDAVSSYVVNRINKNNIYLLERATGKEAGNRDTSSESLYQGHSHAGATSVTTKSASLGAKMDHALGAWAYGTARNGPTGSHPDDDMANTGNTTWTGRIFAPALSTGTTASQEIVRHPVRLPLMEAGDYAHGTGKMNFAALVRKTHSKSGNIQITAQMKSADGTSSGTSQNVATTGTSDGIYLLQITGLDAAGSSAGEVEQLLSVSMAFDTNSSPGACLYGTCLWIEP